MGGKTRLLVYIDGGSQGNPGPAACAAIVKTADDGQTVLEEGKYLGQATNNVAEYEALLLGLGLAAQLHAEAVEIRSDSELLVRQLTGEYRVKNPRLQELHADARRALAPFGSVDIRHVPREENVEADRLVGETIRKHRSAGGGKGGAGRKPPGSGAAFRLK